jgi:nitrite reductase (NADH) large subunit
MGRIVIIGGGIAALSAAETIRKNDKVIPITIISDEKYLPYSRIKLSKYICRDFKEEELYLHKPEWYSSLSLELMQSEKVAEINAGKSIVKLESDEEIAYTSLIIACGSNPFIPPIKGADKKGIYTIRKIDDIKAIRNYYIENKVNSVSVIGGGLLGLEAAWAFRELETKININVVENLPRLLPRQMDEEGSNVLENLLSSNSINLYKGNPVAEILGNNASSHIILGNGTIIESELIIISAGVHSNIELSKKSGVSVNRGIIVDEFMRTNYQNIYSAGDCATAAIFLYRPTSQPMKKPSWKHNRPCLTSLEESRND